MSENGDLKKWLNQQALSTFKHLPHVLFGKPVTIRQLTGAERDELEKARLKRLPNNRDVTVDDINWRNIRALHVAYYLGDEEGKRIFRNADVDQIGEWPASVVEEIYDLGLKQNGQGEDDVTEAAKNSETTRC